MKSLNKITALILAFILSLTCLVACGGGNSTDDPKDLQTDKYTVNIKMSFSTDDEKMSAAVDDMQDVTATLSVDKKKFKLDSTTAVDDMTVTQSYVFVASQLYHSFTVEAEDGETTLLKKAVISNTDRTDLIASLGTGANIGLSDFKVHNTSKDGKISTYSCTGVTNEAKESLGAIMSSRFEGLGATVTLDSAEYTLERTSGRDTSSTLVCDYSITLNGQTYTVTLTTDYTYDYTADFTISAPQNADEYTDVPCSEIIG